MRIGLIDVDGHNYPNLALMKLSAYHKAQGDAVEMWLGLKEYDRVYVSRVFDDTYTRDMDYCIRAGEVVRGGTGYDLKNKLPDAVEHMCPDYTIYPALAQNTAYGFLTRGCPRNCGFCVVGQKEGLISRQVADVGEWWQGQKNIVLLDPNITACKDRICLLRQLADTGAWVDFSQGLDARLLDDDAIHALNGCKTKMLHFAWDDVRQEESVMRGLRLYLKMGAVQDFRRRRVYVLTNYNSTYEQDLYRVYKLREMGYDPFVMIYDKPHAPRITRHLARWVNRKEVFRTIVSFDYYSEELARECARERKVNSEKSNCHSADRCAYSLNGLRKASKRGCD